jgi:hypothetical protein
MLIKKAGPAKNPSFSSSASRYLLRIDTVNTNPFPAVVHPAGLPVAPIMVSVHHFLHARSYRVPHATGRFVTHVL